MFEVDFADMCAEKFPLMLIGDERTVKRAQTLSKDYHRRERKFISIVIKDEEVEDTVFEDIHQALLIICLGIFLILQIINTSAVVKVLMDMKHRRRVSFSSTVQKKEIPRASMYVESPRREEEEQVTKDGITQQNTPKTYVTIDLEDRGGTGGSRNGLMFTFDSQKFD